MLSNTKLEGLKMVIKIKNLRLKGIIGIYEKERAEPQDIIINIELEADVQKATSTDHINDTIDYDSISEKVSQLVQKSQFNLLEKLAQTIIDIVMEDHRVIKASVEIDKPQAIPQADSVSLTHTASATAVNS